jgi:RNA polymerase sigma factor (TIGR02999 family)
MAEGDGAGDARALLRGWREGNLAARDRLFEIFYPDLRRSAAAMLRRERGVSLSTGDLIHETVTRLIALNRIDWNDRAHFMALSARMMRRALLDHIRAKRALKREHEKVELSTGIGEEPNIEIEELNAALERLATIDPERAEIVEMRYFGGMEIVDIAQVLHLSESTVKRRWATARLWLLEALTHQGG